MLALREAVLRPHHAYIRAICATSTLQMTADLSSLASGLLEHEVSPAPSISTLTRALARSIIPAEDLPSREEEVLKDEKPASAKIDVQGWRRG